MIAQIVMPSMGATGEDVVIAEWLVKVGDFVQKGQQIFVAETDKATTEVEAFRAGYVRKILVMAREVAALGDPLAIIADSLDEPLEDTAVAAPVAAAPVPQAPAPPSPCWPQTDRVQSSPLARRLAKERGIDLATVKVDGPIHKQDVLHAVASSGTDGERRIAFSPMRRAIAARTLQSKTQSPHFYVTVRIDMSEAVALQRKLATQSVQTARPSATDLVIRAAAMALGGTPELNASCRDNQIVRYDDINIGLVIGLPEGMIIPVIKCADTQDIYRLAATTKRLRDQAVSGTLAQSDLTQGTFTISNLGMFGIESFIAVINPPEAGILAIGAIQPQPAVVEDRLVVRALMTATLSIDHRVVDGITAAKFLGELRQCLENPATLLPTIRETHP